MQRKANRKPDVASSRKGIWILEPSGAAPSGEQRDKNTLLLKATGFGFFAERLYTQASHWEGGGKKKKRAFEFRSPRVVRLCAAVNYVLDGLVRKRHCRDTRIQMRNKTSGSGGDTNRRRFSLCAYASHRGTGRLFNSKSLDRSVGRPSSEETHQRSGRRENRICLLVTY